MLLKAGENKRVELTFNEIKNELSRSIDGGIVLYCIVLCKETFIVRMLYPHTNKMAIDTI